MHVAEYAIRRWQLTLVLFALLAMLGFSAFKQIPRAIDPHFSMPVVAILAVQPGADASDIEQTITKPIEELLQGLEDAKKITSTSKDGSAVIRVEFDWSGEDPDEYFNNVVREVSAIRSQLPEKMASLKFEKMRTSNTAVVQIALMSETASWYRMEKYARDISEAFGRNPDVREAIIHGLPQPEISISIKPGKLAELRMPASAVADAIRLAGADIPAGSVTSGKRRFSVESGGAFKSLDEIRALPLRSSDGSILRVGDVATVKWGAEEQRVRASHNGKRAVFIAANQKEGTDATRLREQLSKQLEKQKSLLPPDMDVILQFDQSKEIAFRLGTLARDFSIAFFLVIFTLLPLGFRASSIVMISIPLSLASGLLGLYLTGYNFSQFVVAGFILSLGLLVDDSIVVVENIARHLRLGKPRDIAAIDGTKEITRAVLGSTGVLLAVFLPLLFMPEGAGKFMRSFFVAILYTVAASMVISLTIIPFLSSRILKREEKEEGNAILRAVMRYIDRIYRPLLHRALSMPRRTVWGALIITCSALLLVPILGLTLFPRADTSYFRVRVDMEQGASMDETARVTHKISNILKSEPDIKYRIENVGAHNPQVFYNVYEVEQDSGLGEIIAVMDRWKGGDSVEMIERLRTKLDKIVGANVRVILYQGGGPVKAPIEFRVQGPDLAVLKSLAGKVEQIMRDNPQLRDVNNPVAIDRIDLDVNINDAKAALLDIPAGAPRRAIRLALSGEESGKYRDSEGDSYPVMTRLALNNTQPVSALDKIYVPTRSGQPVQLSQISDPKLVSAPSSISRYQLQRFVGVSAQIEQGGIVSKVNRAVKKEIEKIELPAGYSIKVGGETEELNATFAGFGPVILTAFFAIFAILVAEFGRFREALVVAGVIPLGIFGGMISLLVTGNSLSFLAVVGFVALIGIEIKNSILLVDFTSQLREQGMGLRAAIEKAGEVRFLPVLLTSATAIFGLLPLAIFGGNLYGPLAIVIIGGLVSSTLLSRIVTPAMYLLVVRGAKDDDMDKQIGATTNL